jgi:uncharacterized protein YdeI (YjbR/CyaY-like superfamily)
MISCMEVGHLLHFADQPAWRRWLEEHHETADEVWVGFHRKSSGRPSIDWAQSVDEALCFGWIDGIRKRVDESSYTNRFTPRRPGSVWSRRNTERMGELIAAGQVAPAGLRAFAARDEARSGVYSFEQGEAAALTPAQEERIRASPAAWADWAARPAGYRRAVVWWVVGAKREETRERRLAALVECSERGEEVPPLRRR